MQIVSRRRRMEGVREAPDRGALLPDRPHDVCAKCWAAALASRTDTRETLLDLANVLRIDLMEIATSPRTSAHPAAPDAVADSKPYAERAAEEWKLLGERILDEVRALRRAPRLAAREPDAPEAA